MSEKEIKDLLDHAVKKYNRKSFISDDPISIPHQFSKLQDIEIAGFWTAILSWGLRKTIINKSNELIDLMDHAPYDFIMNHKPKDRKRFSQFKHRTFQYTDTLYFLSFFQWYYRQHESLETAFSTKLTKDSHVGPGLIHFESLFKSLDHFPQRTQKHVSSPVRKSTCKRINMFLRWMVRKDSKQVDFGLWKKIKPSQLLIPYDVHVDKVARKLGIIQRKQRDWQTVLELTSYLKKLNPRDPVKYDYALFSLGTNKEL